MLGGKAPFGVQLITSRSEPRHRVLYYWQPASAFEQLFARLVSLKHRKLPLDEAIGCI